MCVLGGGGVRVRAFREDFLFIVRVFLSEFWRMYVELSAALKIFENFLFRLKMRLLTKPGFKNLPHLISVYWTRRIAFLGFVCP